MDIKRGTKYTCCFLQTLHLVLQNAAPCAMPFVDENVSCELEKPRPDADATSTPDADAQTSSANDGTVSITTALEPCGTGDDSHMEDNTDADSRSRAAVTAPETEVAQQPVAESTQPTSNEDEQYDDDAFEASSPPKAGAASSEHHDSPGDSAHAEQTEASASPAEIAAESLEHHERNGSAAAVAASTSSSSSPSSRSSSSFSSSSRRSQSCTETEQKNIPEMKNDMNPVLSGSSNAAAPQPHDLPSNETPRATTAVGSSRRQRKPQDHQGGTPRDTASRQMLTVTTPLYVNEDATIQDVFLRSIGATGMSQRSSGEAVRRWVNPYESRVPHTRLVLRDVQLLDEQRKREAEEYRLKQESKRADEEEKRRKMQEEEASKKKVAETSPRLCKPKHQRPKVGVYAPRPQLKTVTSESSLSSGGRKGYPLSTQLSYDSMPHYMRPLPPPKEPKPIAFRPQTQLFHQQQDEEGAAAEDGPVLSAEEFAQRFFHAQVEGHHAALNKSFVKLTGAPMPPRPPPPPKLQPLPPPGSIAKALAEAAEEEEDEEEMEKRERELEFVQGMGRRFHDEELEKRSRSREALFRKYGLSEYFVPDAQPGSVSRQRRSTATGGSPDADDTAGGASHSHQSVASPSHDDRPRGTSSVLTAYDKTFAAKMYEAPLAHQKETLMRLWNAMDARTEKESVHHGTHMTKAAWETLLSRVLTRK